jgi:uncharacterized C2H2 Zn-finger protein
MEDVSMEVIAAPYDRTIFVGSGHTDKTKCPNSSTPHYSKGRVQFETRRGGPLILTVKICPACGAIFVPYKKYEKHWVRFDNYTFLRSKDGKLPSEERIRHSSAKADPNYVPPKIDYHEIYKTPDYIRNGLRRPFQGGSVSPR